MNNSRYFFFLIVIWHAPCTSNQYISPIKLRLHEMFLWACTCHGVMKEHILRMWNAMKKRNNLPLLNISGKLRPLRRKNPIVTFMSVLLMRSAHLKVKINFSILSSIFFRYYLYLMPIACFLIPTIIPMYFWGESFTNAWFVATMFRWTFILNVTWLVNSAAHKWGDKPYDV